MTRTAFLGIGSNLGARLEALQQAGDLLQAEPGLSLTGCSRVWETRPVGGPPQPDFLNVVVRAAVEVQPIELLDACQRVEAALGRVRTVRWGPRTVDVDVLLIDDLSIDEPRLVVPHPRMRERAFVLLPLLDVEPAATLPDGTRVADVALDLDAQGAQVHAPPLRVGSAP